MSSVVDESDPDMGSAVLQIAMHAPWLFSWTVVGCTSSRAEFNSFTVSLSHPWPMATRRMIICGERDCQKGRHSLVIPLRNVHLGRLNAEHAPDMTKRIDERSILGRYDDQSDSKDSKGCRRLDDHRSNAYIHVGRLGGKHLPRKCSQPQDTEANHRGDDDIQAHAQRYPRREGVDRLSVQNKRVHVML